MSPLVVSSITIALGLFSVFSALLYFFMLRAYRLGRTVDRLMWDIRSLHDRIEGLEGFLSAKSGFTIRDHQSRTTPEGMEF